MEILRTPQSSQYGNFKDSLQKSQARSFDIGGVTLDFNERNIKEIRKDLPIIAQTALVLDEYKEKCLEAGCNEYISQPIERKWLLKIIDNYFQ